MLKTKSESAESRLIVEALVKWTELPSRTIARKLIQDNPGVWLKRDLDNVRTRVRYLRGKHGQRDRSNRGSLGFAKQLSPSVPHDPRKYIPPSDEKEFLPFILDPRLNRDAKIDVMGDLHFPYHSVKAVKAMLDKMDEEPPDIILLNGDTLDFYKLSRFMKDPRCRSVKGEIAIANEFLDALEERFPKARKIWKDGNHDERLDHYIMQCAPEIYDLKTTTVAEQMELADRGWEYVTEKRPIYAGKLNIIHGHEYPTPVLGPVNAARGLFLRTKACALVNHHHQTSEHSEPDIRDSLIACWSLGCLCELHPAYARFNKWNHGYARVRLAQNGDFQVTNRRIHHGRILN